MYKFELLIFIWKNKVSLSLSLNFTVYNIYMYNLYTCYIVTLCSCLCSHCSIKFRLHFRLIFESWESMTTVISANCLKTILIRILRNLLNAQSLTPEIDILVNLCYNLILPFVTSPPNVSSGQRLMSVCVKGLLLVWIMSLFKRNYYPRYPLL